MVGWYGTYVSEIKIQFKFFSMLIRCVHKIAELRGGYVMLSPNTNSEIQIKFRRGINISRLVDFAYYAPKNTTHTCKL